MPHRSEESNSGFRRLTATIPLHRVKICQIWLSNPTVFTMLTRSSAIAEGLGDMLVSTNPATTKHPI